MTPPNGHADESSGRRTSDSQQFPPASIETATGFTRDQMTAIIAELEVPFEPVVIEWRVTNTAQNKSRGQVIPYADQRAYTDRLNRLLTPGGWTRKYEVHTSPNFQRSKD